MGGFLGVEDLVAMDVAQRIVVHSVSVLLILGHVASPCIGVIHLLRLLVIPVRLVHMRNRPVTLSFVGCGIAIDEIVS